MDDATLKEIGDLLSGVNDKFSLLLQNNQILTRLDAMDARIAAGFKRIDDATTGIAAKIKELTGQLASATSQADVDALVTQINGEATKLEGIAADPENPVPPASEPV